MIILPRDDVKKQEVLQIVVEKFEEGKNYFEEEVNNIIKACDVDDYVLFRRELVNFNYLGKDSYKGIYWVKKYSLSDKDLDNISSNQKKWA